ncbi:MAG: hypothetical protein R2764_14245 [Bacteroidales bacterium]
MATFYSSKEIDCLSIDKCVRPSIIIYYLTGASLKPGLKGGARAFYNPFKYDCFCKMSLKHKFKNPEGMYFVTFAVVGWVDVFTRDVYREIFADSLNWSKRNKV